MFAEGETVAHGPVMDFQVATLCDSAADYQGKLCVLGTFDTIMAPDLPAAHPQCSVALRVAFRKGEEGEHSFQVRIVDEDGGSIVPPIDAKIMVQIPENVFFFCRNAVLNFQQLKFEKEGYYSVDVDVDGVSAVSIPLQVRRVRQG